jgi:sugar phosphate isomerase/epimerase
MKLGANSVLFGGHSMETAFKYIAMAGYDGIEISAIGAGEHLELDRWQEIAPEIKRLSKEYGLELLAIERSNTELVGAQKAFEAAAELGIPVVAFGPGGRADDEASFQQSVDTIGKLCQMAESYGVTVCVKAHVGAAIWNTPTMLRLMDAITSPAFGVNMDPSHIHRAGENPVEALKAVIHRVKHLHIRDCKGRQQNPGKPEMQANGRGDIDLLGYIRVLHEGGYTGALDLEVIGAKAYDVTQCAVIAAESRGHMQACLQACGAR